VRRLANSLPGEKASAIHFEAVGHFAFPATAIVANNDFSMRDMTVYSYQLVFPTAASWSTRAWTK